MEAWAIYYLWTQHQAGDLASPRGHLPPTPQATQPFFGYQWERGREAGWAQSPQDGTSQSEKALQVTRLCTEQAWAASVSKELLLCRGPAYKKPSKAGDKVCPYLAEG